MSFRAGSSSCGTRPTLSVSCNEAAPSWAGASGRIGFARRDEDVPDPVDQFGGQAHTVTLGSDLRLAEYGFISGELAEDRPDGQLDLRNLGDSAESVV
jgi:hypothetical protein